MFFYEQLLGKKGALGQVWLAAHCGDKKLSKKDIEETDIRAIVDTIAYQQDVPLALRVLGHLLLGVCRIYLRKAALLEHESSDALLRVKLAFRTGSVDMASSTAPLSAITLPQVLLANLMNQMQQDMEFSLRMADLTGWSMDPSAFPSIDAPLMGSPDFLRRGVALVGEDSPDVPQSLDKDRFQAEYGAITETSDRQRLTFDHEMDEQLPQVDDNLDLEFEMEPHDFYDPNQPGEAELQGAHYDFSAFGLDDLDMESRLHGDFQPDVDDDLNDNTTKKSRKRQRTTKVIRDRDIRIATRDYDARMRDTSDIIREPEYVPSSIDELESHRNALLVSQADRLIREGAIMPFQDMASELQQLYTRTIPHLEGLEEDESIDAVRRGQSIMEAEEDSGLFEHDNTMDFMDEEMDMHEEVAAPLPDEGYDRDIDDSPSTTSFSQPAAEVSWKYTKAFHSVLSKRFQEEETVSYASIPVTKRMTAARTFYSILVMNTRNMIEAEQDEPYSDIHIQKTDNFERTPW